MLTEAAQEMEHQLTSDLAASLGTTQDRFRASALIAGPMRVGAFVVPETILGFNLELFYNGPCHDDAAVSVLSLCSGHMDDDGGANRHHRHKAGHRGYLHHARRQQRALTAPARPEPCHRCR